jgi:hypothetical protein
LNSNPSNRSGHCNKSTNPTRTNIHEQAVTHKLQILINKEKIQKEKRTTHKTRQELLEKKLIKIIKNRTK